MKIVVAVTLYNSADDIEIALLSIMSQKYKNFICYITDDMSTDNSADIAEKLIADDDRFKLIRNTEKRYQGGNYDLICRDMPDVDDDDIIIEVDGDDRLANSKVFDRVIETYESGDIWIANGSFIYADGRMGFSKPVTDIAALRHGPYTASHLRTWKAFLWRAIRPEDLRNSDGDWWDCSCDLVFMYDMFELAGLEHYTFMETVHYIYNDENPFNEHKQYMPKIQQMIQMTRNKTPRERLIRT